MNINKNKTYLNRHIPKAKAKTKTQPKSESEFLS